jgi:hypothetical protein
MRVAFLAVLALLLAGPPGVSQTQAPPAADQPEWPQSFAQFRDRWTERARRDQETIPQRLASPELTAEQRERLNRRKVVVDRFLALSPSRQNRMLSRVFNRIDRNRDGQIDHDEWIAYRAMDRAQRGETAETDDDSDPID